MKQIEVDYEIGQVVRIKLNKTVGRVRGIWKDKDQIEYRVEWALSDTSIHGKWFRKDELEEVTKGTEYFPTP